MPKVSGLEVLREIKSDARLKNLPVVMLTSSRQGPDIAECYELGASAFVVMPVCSAEFFEAVKALGKFWAVVNERPEGSKAGEAGDELLATGRV
jgi:CheY-like chemotaxis protein